MSATDWRQPGSPFRGGERVRILESPCGLWDGRRGTVVGCQFAQPDGGYFGGGWEVLVELDEPLAHEGEALPDVALPPGSLEVLGANRELRKGECGGAVPAGGSVPGAPGNVPGPRRRRGAGRRGVARG